MDLAVRASVERVTLLVQEELVSLLATTDNIELYPGGSAGALTLLADGVSQVARAYQQFAMVLLAAPTGPRAGASRTSSHEPDQFQPDAQSGSSEGHVSTMESASCPLPVKLVDTRIDSAFPATSDVLGAPGVASEKVSRTTVARATEALPSPPTHVDDAVAGLLQTEPASSGDNSSGSSASNSARHSNTFGEDVAHLLASMPPLGSPSQHPKTVSTAGLGSHATPQQVSGFPSQMPNSSDPTDVRNSAGGSFWGSRSPLRMSEDSNGPLLLQQCSAGVSTDAEAAGNNGVFGRYVSAGATASPSFLKSVHAALASGSLGKPVDVGDRSSAPAGVRGGNAASSASALNRLSNERLAQVQQPAAGVDSDGVRVTLSGPLYLVGDHQEQQGQGYGPGSATQPSHAGMGLLPHEGTGNHNAALSASLMAQHNMLQQAQQATQVQQAQQLLYQYHQQEKHQLQQQQLMQVQAQEQQRLMQGLANGGAGLVQYADARALLASQAGADQGHQFPYHQVDLSKYNMMTMVPGAEGELYTTVAPSGHAVTFTHASQDRASYAPPDPTFSLFDLQPQNPGMTGGYHANSAQHTLSMFAAAAGNRTPQKSPSPTDGHPINLQPLPTLGTNGLGSMCQMGSMVVGPGSSQSPTHTLSLSQLASSAGVNSEPLPLLMAGNFNNNSAMHGGSGVLFAGSSGQFPSSSPDLSYLSGYSQSNNGILSNSARLSGYGAAGMTLAGSISLPPSRPGSSNTPPASPLQARVVEMPVRFKVLPVVVQQRVMALCRSTPVITIRDFDEKVVSKLSLLVDSWGSEQALAMLEHLEHRMRTKQGAMKNGPGYLDVAVCSHLDMLKAQGTCPKSMKLDEYAQQVLAPAVFHELCEAVSGNRWLAWEHFDQGIIQLVKRLPAESAVEKLQEITYHSFKNVDNIKGCIMSILNSKIREDRRRQ